MLRLRAEMGKKGVAPSEEKWCSLGISLAGSGLGSRSIVVVSFSPVSQYKWLKYIRDHIRLD